jgi:hypothetical protein
MISRRLIGFRGLVLPVILAAVLFAAPAIGQTTAIRAGNLIDPAAGTIAKGQIILVKDGKIAEVGPNVKIPAGAEVIDLTNTWVMPGLMDAHTHITLYFDTTSGFDMIYLGRAPPCALGPQDGPGYSLSLLMVVRDVGSLTTRSGRRDAIRRAGSSDRPF